MRPYRVLGRSQREVLNLLRIGMLAAPAGAAATAGDCAGDALLRLARSCADHDIPPSGRHAPYVTSGECLILAALALWQRPTLPAPMGQSPLLKELAACAAALLADDIVLPLTTTGWALLVQHGWAAERTPGTTARIADRRRAAAEARPLPPEPGSLRHKAVSLASGRETIRAAEFARAGISRQMLSIICADGLFERVRFGEYRLAAAIEGPASDRDVTS